MIKDQKTPKVTVKVCHHSFKATVDTGTTINVIDKNTYDNMSGPQLKEMSIKAFAYNATKPVQFFGKFEALTETKKRIAVATLPRQRTGILSTSLMKPVVTSLHLAHILVSSDISV